MRQINQKTLYLPKEWVEAIASLQDTATYPDLIKYFARCNGTRSQTFNAIKNLPGIDLKGAVAEAWKRAKFQSESEMMGMCPIAAEFGNIEALDAAAKYLKSEKQNNYERKRASELLRKFTPATGEDQALLAWYDAHRSQLGFDADSKKFVMKP